MYRNQVELNSHDFAAVDFFGAVLPFGIVGNSLATKAAKANHKAPPCSLKELGKIIQKNVGFANI